MSYSVRKDKKQYANNQKKLISELNVLMFKFKVPTLQKKKKKQC